MRTYIRVNNNLEVVEVLEANVAAGFLISPRTGIQVGDTLTAEELDTMGYRSAPPVINPTEWLIDVGAFFDRFGPAKMAVLSSADSTVRAIVQDVMVRKWIDLKRFDVEQAVDLLIAKQIPGMDEARKTVILETPVLPDENLALRRSYFS